MEMMEHLHVIFFFFQAEDGIRDVAVTGVQTYALPISKLGAAIRLASRSPQAATANTVANTRKPARCAIIASLSLPQLDRKSTRLNSSHGYISYAVFCLKKKKKN